jgi:hypothetical protein
MVKIPANHEELARTKLETVNANENITNESVITMD